nr:nucleic acid-binding, OB-fold protein [Tanacetum cinerariifolium]
MPQIQLQSIDCRRIRNIVGSSCTQLVKKHGIPNPREFPDEILSLTGRTHIFQLHYNPSCVAGRIDFYFDDILDKPLQITGASETHVESTELLPAVTPTQTPAASGSTQILTETPPTDPQPTEQD